MLTDLADRLVARFEAGSDEQWRWIGDELTYANAKLPHALLLAGAATEERATWRSASRPWTSSLSSR